MTYETNFENIEKGLIQGCTIRKSNDRNLSNLLVLTCITCGQTGFYENAFDQGKAAGLHFANKDKYPIG